MLLSDSYNFLFIHVNKVAGNSIVTALRRQIHSPAARVNIRLDEICMALGTGLQRRAGLGIRLHNPLNRDRYKFLPKHVTASKMHELLGSDYYNSLFKFAFVRNPWDRVVSRYHYARGHASHTLHDKVSAMTSFDEYVEWAVSNTKPFLQTRLLCDESGRVIVDYVGKFERLADDFSEICNRIGLPEAELGHLNPSRQRESRGYRKYYNNRTIELVADFCRSDIDTFRFEF